MKPPPRKAVTPPKPQAKAPPARKSATKSARGAGTMLAIPADDPFVALDGAEFANPEIEAEAELSALSEGFRSRMKKEAERLASSGVDYYFMVVFQTGDQATAFLKAMSIANGPRLMIDGNDLAARLGIELPPGVDMQNPGKRIDADFAARARKKVE